MRALFFSLLLVFVLAQESFAFCNKRGSVSAFEDASYYAAAQGLEGGALKTALNKIIRGHKSYSYSCVWDILKESDEDPNNPNNVILFYKGNSILKGRRVGRSGNDKDAWNREHVWPKSHGFKGKSQHAHTDAHQLRPSDVTVNSDRGNLDFDDGGEAHRECEGCARDRDSWSPALRTRGDTARILFYMVTRYEGSDRSQTGDLELVDRMTSIGQKKLGKLCTVYKWHFDDPVDAFEARRNEVVYQWQGNRNPFIDHPEYVQKIWGASCPDVLGELPDKKPTTPIDNKDKDKTKRFSDHPEVNALIQLLIDKGLINESELLELMNSIRK